VPAEIFTRPVELPPSRLYTFIDHSREFALYFLEGQRLIQDLALRHAVSRDGFAYFRDAVLSVQPMIALLNGGEQFGFYIDSEEPYFRLKIETAHNGDTRSTLMPEGFREFPDAVHGVVRLLKLYPDNRQPYGSVIESDGLTLRSIVNHVLRDSYQVNSVIAVAESSDQSLMLHQLPPLPRKENYTYSLEATRARRSEIEGSIEEIFARGLHAPEEITAAFSEIEFRLLASRPVMFRCSCSHERVVDSIRVACGPDYAELFDPGQPHLQVTCEYCKSGYEVTREQLESGSALPN
jgi:molecular chaperone Hsp33